MNLSKFKKPIESMVYLKLSDNFKFKSIPNTNQILSRLSLMYFDTLNKTYQMKVNESTEFNIPFSHVGSLNLAINSAIRAVENYLKENITLDKYFLNILTGTLKGSIYLQTKQIFSGNTEQVIHDDFDVQKVKIRENKYLLQDILDRLAVTAKLKRLLRSNYGIVLMETFLQNNEDMMITAYSKQPKLLEALLLLSDDGTLDTIVSSIGLLKLILINPDILDLCRQKPKLVKLFKNKNYDDMANQYGKKLTKILSAIPNRISRSPVGSLNVSNLEYAKLKPKTREYIDTYRDILSDYYQENLYNIFESHICHNFYQELRDISDENLRDSLAVYLTEEFLKIFKKKFSEELKESLVPQNSMSKYFTQDSSIMISAEYALEALQQEMLSEGIFSTLKDKIFGSDKGISQGALGTFKNWMKDTSISRFFRSVSNTISSDISNWQKTMNPMQQKTFKEYPYLTALFAGKAKVDGTVLKPLDVNLAVRLVNNKDMMSVLERFPRMALKLRQYPKMAEFLLRKEPELLDKMMQNLDVTDWLLNNEKLGRKLFSDDPDSLDILHACLLNFDLATKLANDYSLVDEIGTDNLVDLAELMNDKSDFAKFIQQLDGEQFKNFVTIIFDNVKIFDFFNANPSGKILMGIAVRDKHDIVLNAILTNPSYFTGEHNVQKIEGNTAYNKLLAKYASKFPRSTSSDESNSGNDEDDTGTPPPASNANSFESSYNYVREHSSDSNIVRSFATKYISKGFNYTNADDRRQNYDLAPEFEEPEDKKISKAHYWCHRKGTKYEAVPNLFFQDFNKLARDAYLYYVFDVEGSLNDKGLQVIKPAVFEREDNQFTLVTKGKLKLFDNHVN